jgi:hypothetical protein
MDDRCTQKSRFLWICFGHHLLEPQRLLVLLRLAAAHQHHVEPDKTPALRTFCDIFDPAIWAEMTLPRAKPLTIDWLVGMTRVADVMVARHRPPADSEFVHQLSGVTKVNFDSGAIAGHIAGMDYEVGMLGRRSTPRAAANCPRNTACPGSDACRKSE